MGANNLSRKAGEKRNLKKHWQKHWWWIITIYIEMAMNCECSKHSFARTLSLAHTNTQINFAIQKKITFGAWFSFFFQINWHFAINIAVAAAQQISQHKLNVRPFCFHCPRVRVSDKTAQYWPQWLKITGGKSCFKLLIFIWKWEIRLLLIAFDILLAHTHTQNQ